MSTYSCHKCWCDYCSFKKDVLDIHHSVTQTLQEVQRGKAASVLRLQNESDIQQRGNSNNPLKVSRLTVTSAKRFIEQKPGNHEPAKKQGNKGIGTGVDGFKATKL